MLDIIYLILFGGLLVLSFIILVKSTRFNSLFKQGKTIAITISALLVSVIFSYLLTSAIMRLIEVIQNLLLA